MRDEMLIAAICEKMGWDYFTYCDQPQWFIQLLTRKFEVDSKEQRNP